MSDYRQAQEQQEHQEELISAVLEKAAHTLTEDEMSLLRWATGVTERTQNGNQDK